MSVLSEASRFRRLAAGLGLILGPAVLIAVELVHPQGDSDAAQMYAIVSANTDQWYLAHALALVSIALAVPAVLGLMHLLKTSQPAWGHVGAALAFLGLVPLAAAVGMELVVWQATSADAAAMIALIDRVNDSAGTLIVFAAALLFPIGWIALAGGLYRARILPAWQPALIGLGIVGVFAGDLAYTKWLSVAGALLFFIGAAPLGWRLLTQSDEEWETGRVAPTAEVVPTA
jgi:hypothetical protein